MGIRDVPALYGAARTMAAMKATGEVTLEFLAVYRIVMAAIAKHPEPKDGARNTWIRSSMKYVDAAFDNNPIIEKYRNQVHERT